MPRKKTKKISNWKELIDWIESMNPYENTVVLGGWINNLDEDGKMNIESLVFHRVSTNILLDIYQDDKYNPDKKKKKTKK